MSKHENHRHERAKKLMAGGGCGYARGGSVGDSIGDSEPDSGPPNPNKGKKSGGAVCKAEGGSVKKRLDKPKRYASGGVVDDDAPKKKSSAKTQVNIVIAGKGDSAPAAPPMPMPAPAAPPPGGPPPMMPPPGAMPPRPLGLKRGGSVKSSYPIDDGAGGGLGRLQKAAAAKKNHSKRGDS